MATTLTGDQESLNGAFKFTQPPPSPFSGKTVMRERTDNREVSWLCFQ